MTLIKKIISFSLTDTARDSYLLLSGSIVSTVFGFFLTVFLTKALSVSDFGIFITAMAFSQLIAEILEFGLNSATINFAVSSKKEETPSYLKTTLLLRVISLSVVFFVAMLFTKDISQFVFSSPQYATYVLYSMVGAVFFLLITWAQSVFQSQRKFLASSIVNASINTTRLGIVLLLLYTKVLDVQTIFIAVQAITGISVFLVFLQTYPMFLSSHVHKRHIQQVLSFGIPVGLGIAVAAMYSRIDQIVVFQLVGEREAGIFGLASRISSSVLFAGYAFGSAVIPRYISLHSRDFLQYFAKTMIALFGFSLCIIFGIFLAPILIPLLFGAQFLEAIIPFQILAVGTIFFIFSLMISNVLIYRYKKVKFSMIISVLSLVVMYILLQVFVLQYKSLGAAFAVSAAYFVQVVISSAYFYQLVKRNEKLK